MQGVINTLRPLLLGGLLLAVPFAASPAKNVKPDPNGLAPHAVQDLAYGDVLFYFYEDDYFDSITRLLAARQLGRVPHTQEEAELLFPANTQVALYVSMDVGTFFALDAVTVKIDNKEVKNYLYTAREADALLKGGVQQIYLGNLKVGKHELVAFFTGKGPVERDYKRGAAINFDKGVGAKYLELKITDRVPKHQPEFLIKDWE